MGHFKHINLKNHLWNIRSSLGKTGLAQSGGGVSTLSFPLCPFIFASKNVMRISDVLFFLCFHSLFFLFLLSLFKFLVLNC